MKVQTGSIDHGIERRLFPAPCVLKIDVEGAEAHVLCGMQRLLQSSQSPRAIFIELHPTFLPHFDAGMDEVESLFSNAGYRCTYDTGRFDQVHRAYRR